MDPTGLRCLTSCPRLAHGNPDSMVMTQRQTWLHNCAQDTRPHCASFFCFFLLWRQEDTLNARGAANSRTSYLMYRCHYLVSSHKLLLLAITIIHQMAVCGPHCFPDEPTHPNTWTALSRVGWDQVHVLFTCYPRLANEFFWVRDSRFGKGIRCLGKSLKRGSKR